MTRRTMCVAALIAALAGPGIAAAAEPEARPIAASVTRMIEASAIEGEPWLVSRPAAAGIARQQTPGQPGATSQTRSRASRAGRAIAGAAVGAIGGAFAGGYLGAALEPDCGCDDPGLKGFLIGFPVGGLLVGVFGGFYLFR